jgi:hypothetical protein
MTTHDDPQLRALATNAQCLNSSHVDGSYQKEL